MTSARLPSRGELVAASVVAEELGERRDAALLRATRATLAAGSMPEHRNARAAGSTAAGSRRCWRSRRPGCRRRSCARAISRSRDRLACAQHRVGERREVDVVAEQLLGRHRLGDLHQRAGRAEGQLERVASAPARPAASASAARSRAACVPERQDRRADAIRAARAAGGRWLMRDVSCARRSRGTRRSSVRSPSSSVNERLPAEHARAPSRRSGTGGGSRCVASLRTSGSSVESISCRMRSTSSSTVTWISFEKLNASPAQLGLGGQLLGEQHVRGRAVLDVEVVADDTVPSERMTGRCAAQHRSGSCPARCGSSSDRRRRRSCRSG